MSRKRAGDSWEIGPVMGRTGIRVTMAPFPPLFGLLYLAMAPYDSRQNPLYRPLHRPLLGLGLVLALASCQTTGPVDPELKQANGAMAAMAKPASLGKSCFTVVAPNGQPSEFVDYLFSDLGAAEWPIAMDEFEAEQMRSIGQPVVPPTVQVSRNQRQHIDRKELVLRGDDANGMVVAQGYLANGAEPMFEAQWPLATAQPGPGVAELCQSNIEMGISPIPRE